ncbi:EscU/YscU/HrcU family type III secretion system export apparatus switch protein [Thiomicrorhabdus sp. 6S3-12]|uniref:EscU/YscU/HrcU family type III secretion system export apparatus switch protein n=1 Tax=Thiomicrorhabdus sp. 6S3-12 TaxID=2819681 RepID=UPI001AACD1A3|nr:EscU/YscU/HrcU family type III secretion system export apparatus switch protein [Thiomicrorhabdus sp. 6S3-12]MBO1924553.1 EscU/YscU/HrcU family type III secretion system export apparatus switch protein [Thiomicrorhabdus sp. 6S3-12]
MPSSQNTPPQTQAVSLQYDGDGAPKVTAKGQGYIAEEIIQTAKEHHIPIQQDSELVALLGQVQLDQEIPEKLYAAVAQVLLFAYEVSGKELPHKPEDL